MSNDLFTQSSIPQIKCIIENLSKIIYENEKSLHKLFEFLEIYSKMLDSNGSEGPNQIQIENFTTENFKNNINRIYCVTNLLFRRFGKSK